MPPIKNLIKTFPFKSLIKKTLIRPGEHERAVLTGELKGLRFRFDLRSDTQKWRGIYERPLQRWLSEYVEPGSTCLDIGAADGYFTILMAKLAGSSGVVHAFEPSELYERIARHVDINRHNYTLAPVSVHNRFVVSNSAQSDLPTVSVDEVVRNVSLKRVDVIKIDVEGAEADVLRGAQRTLERFRPYLFIEIHSRDLLDDVQQLVGHYGYTFRLENAAPYEYRPGEYNAFLFSEGRMVSAAGRKP
jgi:hypothetical protein